MPTILMLFDLDGVVWWVEVRRDAMDGLTDTSKAELYQNAQAGEHTPGEGVPCL